jgi:hypothetical protein
VSSLLSSPSFKLTFVPAELLQRLDLKGKIPLEIALSMLPDSSSEFETPRSPDSLPC